MNKKQFRPKAGSGVVRNSLAFALAAILVSGPAVSWAEVTAGGSFYESGTQVESEDYDTLAEAAEALNALAGVGPDDSDITLSRPNDLDLTIRLTSDENVESSSLWKGAVQFDGYYSYPDDTDPSITHEITHGFKNITINGNGFALDGSGDSTGTMLAIMNVKETIGISNLYFLKGSAGDHNVAGTYGGAGLFVGANDADGANDPFGSLNLTNVVFQENTVQNTGSSSAAGGGMSVNNRPDGALWTANGTLAMNNVYFVNNSAESSRLTAATDTTARGGGASIYGLGGISYNNGLVSGNSATAIDGSTAYGGGLNIESGTASSTKISGVEFSGNTATVSGTSYSGGTTKAYGGGLYAYVRSVTGSAGTASFTNGTVFSGNKAVAKGSGAQALGGAAAFAGNINASFTGVDFTDNTAEAATGAAYGGAVYSQSSASFTNSSFTGNQASGKTAKGGAVFMDTSVQTNVGVTKTALSMAVGANEEVLISGNKAGDRSSGIHFGNAENSSSALDAEFNIVNAGRMEMLDALTVSMNNGKSFTMNVDGGGVLTWGASNNNISAAGGAEINLNQGTTELTKDFSLTVTGNTDFEMNVTKTGTTKTALNFDSRRYTTQAMFDLTNAANSSSFLVEAAAATMDVNDGRRQLVDYEKTYLIVSGAGSAAADMASQLNNLELGQNIQNSQFTAQGGNVVLDYEYVSPYTSALKAAGKNTVSGSAALTAVLQKDEITEEMLDIIHANYGALTAEYGVVAGSMAMNVNQFISRMAVRQGLKNQHNSSLPTPLHAQPSFGGPNEGPRVWAGYAGNFRTVDSSGGYYGYDQDTSAAILGLSYDLGPEASIGIYGGYSHSKADLDRISSEVETDGTHIGVMARLTPLAYFNDPNLAIYVDAGYSRYENEAYRRLDYVKVRGDFDQKAFTAGLGAEYAVPVDYEVLLTPSLDLRYTWLHQDSFREKGLTASRVTYYELDSFTSSMALSASREISIDGGTITPSARIGWNHEFGDTDVSTTARYINPASGNTFAGPYKLGTVGQNRDSMDAGVGVRALLNSGSYHQVGLNFSYDANISKNADSHTVYGGLEYIF